MGGEGFLTDRGDRQLVVVVARVAAVAEDGPNEHEQQQAPPPPVRPPRRRRGGLRLLGRHSFSVSSRKLSIRLMRSLSGSPCQVWPCPCSTTTSALPPPRCSRSARACACRTGTIGSWEPCTSSSGAGERGE